MFGAIEAGGTKFVCAVSDDNLDIIERITIPTTSPEETFMEVFKLFDKYEIKSIGIGSFGPIDVNTNSSTYGFITTTPKILWRDVNFREVFKERYECPVAWNTDVNAAALGEATIGAASEKDSCVYITVGTGIGGGAVINGKPLTGYSHPEMGHFYVPRHPKDTTFSGVCDYHSDCLEGLASGPSIERRYNTKAENLPSDHEVWEIISFYLAHAALTITTVTSPDCIIFGGGVMQQEHLLNLIRDKFEDILRGYLELPPIDEYLLSTGLGKDSGIVGSLLLAKNHAN